MRTLFARLLFAILLAIFFLLSSKLEFYQKTYLSCAIVKLSLSFLCFFKLLNLLFVFLNIKLSYCFIFVKVYLIVVNFL